MVSLDPRPFIPAGLVVDALDATPERIRIAVHAAGSFAACPGCGRRSAQVHSHYERRPLDLLSHGRVVELRVRARRFRCADAACPRRTFAERLGRDVAPKSAQRTGRLECLIRDLGVALGGRPGAGLAGQLMLPVGKDMLLRAVRRHSPRTTDPVRVVGIDYWAWRRRQRYGTIICDLERRRIVDLLPDREPGAVGAWLSCRPEVTVVARDRGGGYAQAVAAAAPQAIQVADRQHLMEDASSAFLEAVGRSMRPIRQALGCGPVGPVLPTSAERLQHDGHLRCRGESGAIRGMAGVGTLVKEIVRRTGRSRKLVYAVLRGCQSAWNWGSVAGCVPITPGQSAAHAAGRACRGRTSGGGSASAW